MTNSSQKRRGRSMEVVDAKVAVDLATAQTYSENVFLFVPNLIGYSRIILAGLSLYFMSYHPKYCTLAYVVSCLLDAVDGQAARALGQTSKFGAVLDMVTDRCTTSCLLCYLASAYPDIAILFQFLIALDFSSHYMHMYSSLVTGAKSHKLVTSDVSRILWLYYDSRTLFFVCAGNELFYVSLYLMKWMPTPIGLPAPLSWLTYAQALAVLWKASKILVGVDLVERANARKAQEGRERPAAALPSFSLPRRQQIRSQRKRLSTTSDPPPSNDPPNDVPEPIVDDKPKLRRPRLSPSKEPQAPSIELPDDLDILWTPSQERDPLHASALPPPENFNDALNKLLITLHPQTQHRAAYTSPLGAPTEPTLALYSPIEGGDYIIDATVEELARRTGAEVLVLDAVQLAAGEWGHFGPAANSLSLPRNPLHFPSSTVPPKSASRNQADEDDEPDSFVPPKISLALMTPPSTMQGRAILTSAARRTAPPSRVKVFFDSLVNIPSKGDEAGQKNRPRLIYIRDFPTLASTSSSWYPPLLSSVRERRKGPISRPSSPVSNPMTIIFGMTASMTPPATQGGSGSSLVSMLMSRNPSAAQFSSTPKAGKTEWGEDDAAERAREKRLRDRLKKWESGDAVLADEFPKLSTTEEGEETENRPEIIVIGSLGLPGLPGSNSPSSSNNSQNKSSFFRTSILIPRVRSLIDERTVRVARRREINELTMRMGIGAAGGILEQEAAAPLQSALAEVSDEAPTTTSEVSPETPLKTGPPAETAHVRMWEDWGERVEVWSDVRRTADRALGNTLASTAASEGLTLESTVVPWPAVHAAWAAHRSAKDLRSSWLKEAFSVHKVAWEHEKVDEGTEDGTHEQFDEVVERVKTETELERHEEKLLGCIVDAASMPTSFDHVHLPAHTIDSVRTIVSLPLLHPKAFKQGILKQHGMTGCLLFGPPGTGKTLVVRALAKEAGCRMLMVSPSDVMDMYVGEGEKLVKALFTLARRLSPCVVFLDEIDALFGARMSARESGGAFAHRGVITEFMQEMDGLKSSKEDNVIVIGATNRPFDLDDAVLRRLPRRLLVDLPGEKERAEILKILLRDETLATDLDIDALAKKTESFSGSDLKRELEFSKPQCSLNPGFSLDLCVSAALDAVKENIKLPWATPSVQTAALDIASTEATSASATSRSSGDDIPEVSSDSSAVVSPSGESPVSEALSVVAELTPDQPTRILHLHNFAKALKEITPSSSESLGSLAELRKWNDEFGEGRKDKKRQQFWGKGHFGFTDKANKEGEVGRVVHSASSSSSTVE
ncbi:hypothetical protein H0H87_000086 [Tephrocybe sp. NHM501043]|nr:hypothetical protein H0H87_000086 [Tephrocybe sp. NHM501043]